MVTANMYQRYQRYLRGLLGLGLRGRRRAIFARSLRAVPRMTGSARGAGGSAIKDKRSHGSACITIITAARTVV